MPPNYDAVGLGALILQFGIASATGYPPSGAVVPGGTLTSTVDVTGISAGQAMMNVWADLDNLTGRILVPVTVQ